MNQFQWKLNDEKSLNTTTSNTNAGLDAAVDRIEAVELYGPRLTTAEADILAIEAVNVSQDADIAAAVAVNGTQQSEIDALETLTTAQGVTIDSHTSTLATHTTDIADLVTQDATHTSDIAAANSAISSINTNLALTVSQLYMHEAFYLEIIIFYLLQGLLQ